MVFLGGTTTKEAVTKFDWLGLESVFCSLVFFGSTTTFAFRFCVHEETISKYKTASKIINFFINKKSGLGK